MTTYLFWSFGRRPRGGASAYGACQRDHFILFYVSMSPKTISKFSIVDLLVLASMKNAAKCDK